MRNKKTIFFIFSLFLVFASFSFFMGFVKGEDSDEALSGEGLNILELVNSLKAEGKISFFSPNEDGSVITLFMKDVESINLGNNHLENLEIRGDGGSTIKIDLSGNIIEANLYNSKSSKYVINGNEFEVPENGHLSYWNDENVYSLEQGTKVNKLADGSIIRGYNLDLFGNILLDGTCSSSKEGYLVSGDVIYDKINIVSQAREDEGGILIVKDSSADLKNYEGAWIKKVPGGLSVKGDESGFVRLEFLEGNNLINMGEEGLDGNKKRYLSLEIFGDDSVSIYKNNDVIQGLPPRIIHESSKGFGKTTIMNGKHSFIFNDGEFLGDFDDNLNTKNNEAIPLDITSTNLENKILSVNDNNGYVLYDFSTGKKLTFDTSSNGIDYNFNSDIGKEIYNFAEGELGNSAFRHGGRGDICFDRNPDTGRYVKIEVPTENRAYDCIGYALTALTNAYPEDSLQDFPADLRLSNVLEKKGWENYIIEPSSVAGIDKTKELVKNIPAGSIVFLMHDEKMGAGSLIKGTEYAEYINSENEKLTLVLGHTLIRGKGENNFLNAIPSFDREYLPKTALEYNEKMISQNLPAFFQGVVREGKLVPENDYLLVMAPPGD